ncbi:hypothetical protein [Streptomyces sp. NPDC058625]|uniref:hypothetical protein n=1 Tax=Streptomyces sp. NPDC058625 TaxID=3346564 RepID=UPI00364C44F1
MYLLVAPCIRIEQTRRRLAKLHAEGLVDQVTLRQAGRTRCWFLTLYGAQLAFAVHPRRHPPAAVENRVNALNGATRQLPRGVVVNALYALQLIPE